MESRAPFLVALLLAAALPGQERPPSRGEIRELVREWVQLEGWTEDGHARQREILATLERVPPLRASEDRRRRKELVRESMRRGRRLETGGRNHWWEAERRGLYLVGGHTRRPRGLLIAMHGGGVGSGDAGSAHSSYAPAASRLGLVCVSPEVLEKTERGWTDAGTEEWVMALVDAAIRTFGVDPNKVFLAGHSMGGYGSWTLGAHHADRVAGLAPSAGAPTPILERGTDRVVDLVEGVVPNLRNVRIVVFQSTDDPRVPPEPNQLAHRKLQEAREKWGGFDFEYWEVHDRGHGFPEGGVVRLLEKVVDAEREPIPERVVWQPTLPWKRQLYWLYWQTPRAGTVVVADLDREANRISITTDGSVEGLSVLLDDRMVDMDEEVVIELDGQEAYRGQPERTLATLFLTSQHPDPGLQFSARVPVRAPE